MDTLREPEDPRVGEAVGAYPGTHQHPPGIEPFTDTIRESFTRRPVGIWVIRIVTLTLILTAWELYGNTVHPALFTPFSGVVEAFWELGVSDTRLWVATQETVLMLLTGFSIAIVVGNLVGLLMGRFDIVEYVLDPYVSFLYALPTVALLPLFVIWLGIGRASQIAIVFTISVIPVLLNAIAGAKQVSNDLVDVARNYGASRAQILQGVVFPSMLPYIFTGIKVGVGTAFIGTVLGEMLLVVRGLGGMVVEFSHSFEPDKMIAPLMVIVGLSVLIQASLQYARVHLLPWIDPREH